MAQGGPRDDGFGEIAFATTLVDPFLRAGTYEERIRRLEHESQLSKRIGVT